MKTRVMLVNIYVGDPIEQLVCCVKAWLFLIDDICNFVPTSGRKHRKEREKKTVIRILDNSEEGNFLCKLQ